MTGSATTGAHLSASAVPFFDEAHNTTNPAKAIADRIVFKTHYLSRMMGASSHSEFNKLADAWYARLSKEQNRLTTDDREVATNILSVMRTYQDMKTFRSLGLTNAHNFWPTITALLNLKNGKQLVNFKASGKMAEGDQLAFWTKAEKYFSTTHDLCLDQGVITESCTKNEALTRHEIAKHLFTSPSEFSTLRSHVLAKPTLYTMIFETKRLSHHLTAEDQLFCRAVDSMLIRWAKNAKSTAELTKHLAAQLRGTIGSTEDLRAVQNNQLTGLFDAQSIGTTVHNMVFGKSHDINYKLRPIPEMENVRAYTASHAACTGSACDDYWRNIANQIWDQNFSISSGNGSSTKNQNYSNMIDKLNAQYKTEW